MKGLRDSLLEKIRKRGPFSTYFRHLFLLGPISEETVPPLVEQIHHLNATHNMQGVMTKSNPILLHIHCGGGDVLAGMSLVHAIRSSRVPIVAVIMGVCASMATVVSSACAACVMAPMGLYLVHQGRGAHEGTVDRQKMQMEFLEFLESQGNQIYTEKTGQKLTKEELQKLLRGERWLDCVQAARYGFVDAILQPADRTRETYLAENPEWDINAASAVQKRTFSRLFVSSSSFQQPEQGYVALFQALTAPCGYRAKPLVLEFVGGLYLGLTSSFLYMNCLLLSPIPVYGVSTGHLMDSAAWFFLACHRRLMVASGTVELDPRALHNGFQHQGGLEKDYVAGMKVFRRRMAWFFRHIGAPASVLALLDQDQPKLFTHRQAIASRLLDAKL